MGVLIILNSIILLFLSFLHIYWSFGGKWSKDVVIPTNRDGKKIFRPQRGSTLLVGMALLVFAVLTFANSLPYYKINHPRILSYGTGAAGLVFFARAIGDFKFVGFLKRVRHTEFAQHDSKTYSPLALSIAIISFAIALWS